MKIIAYDLKYATDDGLKEARDSINKEISRRELTEIRAFRKRDASRINFEQLVDIIDLENKEFALIIELIKRIYVKEPQ